MNLPKHTPTPWKIMADPDLGGTHPYYDNRWIVTADAQVAFGHDPRPGNWVPTRGRIICEIHNQNAAANAPFVVRACNAHYTLLDACQQAYGLIAGGCYHASPVANVLKAAIAAANSTFRGFWEKEGTQDDDEHNTPAES